MSGRDGAGFARPRAFSPGRLQIDGHSRPLLLVEPAGTATALVLALHGSGSTPDGQRRMSGMDRLAHEGALVVYARGSVRQGFGWRWDHTTDLPFLVALIEQLTAQLPELAGHVVAAGMSGGARMACQLASRRSDLVGTVGAVAGLRAPAVPLLPHPVRVLALHGTSDRVNPYPGGGRAEWQESVPDAAVAWATANGVQSDRTDSSPAPDVTVVTYGGGSAGEVSLWSLGGCGHTWPGGRINLFLSLLLGRTSRAVDATQAIWDCRPAGDRART